MNVNEENDEEKRYEIEVLKSIGHSNIMKIFEFFEDNKNIYLINEFCGGGDSAKYGIFREFFLKYIISQVFLAISFLHSNKVVRADIKGDNIALCILGKRKMKQMNFLKNYLKIEIEIDQKNYLMLLE